MLKLISTQEASSIARQDIARLIDHTALKADTTPEMIRQLCREASEYHFYSVCVNPSFAGLAREELADTGVKICVVIGFPLGAHLSQVKAFETNKAIEDGAEEVDMVINIGSLKAQEFKQVQSDIEAVVSASNGRICKVIIETALLNQEEKRTACLIARDAGAAFVKTSTGFGPAGATVEDVKLMRKVVGENMGVKAAGGIRDYVTAFKMVEAGATRIGASKGIEIIKGGSLQQDS